MGVSKIRFLIVVILLLATALGGCAINFGSKGSTSSTISVKTDTSLTETIKKPFTYKKDQTIHFSYSSKIKEGTLTMRLLDADGNILEDFEVNKKGKKEIKIEKNDTYIVEVDCNQFKGSYQLKWEKSWEKSTEQ